MKRKAAEKTEEERVEAEFPAALGEVLREDNFLFRNIDTGECYKAQNELVVPAPPDWARPKRSFPANRARTTPPISPKTFRKEWLEKRRQQQELVAQQKAQAKRKRRQYAPLKQRDEP